MRMKRIIYWITATLLCVTLIQAAHAADPMDLMSGLLAIFKPYLEALSGKYGWIVSFISIVGTLRLIVKPLMAIARVIVASTRTEKDDEMLDRIEESKAYKAFLFVLDWLASLKLQKIKSTEGK